VDVRDEGGELIGTVCVVPAKEGGGREVVLMYRSGGTRSFGDIAALIRELERRGAPFEARKRVVSFIAERLTAERRPG